MIISKLQYQENMSGSEQALAGYILEYADKVVDLNIRDLASSANSSTSTITRLCRKLGVKGYTDFKVKLASELSAGSIFPYLVDVNVPFEPDHSLEDIAEKIARISIDSIIDTQKSFQYARMENIVRCMLKCTRTNVFGEGDSLSAANEFKNKMLRIKKYVHIEMGYAEQMYQAVNSDRTQAAVVISHSGENENMIHIVKALVKQQAPVILITSEGESTLCGMASYIIRTGAKEKRNMISKLTTYGSQTAVHYILDCLFSFIYKKDYYENLNRALKNEEYIHS